MSTLLSSQTVLLRPIVFSSPLRLVWPPSWVAHIPFAFWLVDALRPRVVVELGTLTGNSFSAFAQAVQTLGLEASCYAVDTWKGDPQTGFYGEEVFEEWSAFHDHHFGAFSSLIRSTFDEAVTKFQDGSIDLLHIDGFHTYEVVRHDFESWLPKLTSSAVVLLHDTNVRERDFGVWKFFQELSREYPCFAFLHGHGLGVIGVGRNLPADVRLLVEEIPRDSQAMFGVRQFFGTLGDGFLRVSAGAELRTRLAGVTSTLQQREQALEAVRAEVARLSQTNATLASQTETLARQLTESDRRLRDLTLDAERRLQESETVRQQEREALQAELARMSAVESQLRPALQQRDEELHQLRVQYHAQVRYRRAAQAEAEQQVARWLQLVLRLRQSRSARATAPIKMTGQLARELMLRARGDARPPEAATPVLAALRPAARRTARAIRESGLFDERFYLRRYPEVAESGQSPLVHYVLAGASERRQPHPLFDPDWYLARLTGSVPANPLEHYLQRGIRERRSPHPLFDASFYLSHEPELAAAGRDPLAHYVSVGAAKGRNPHPLFDTVFYLARNPDVVASGMNPLAHYVQFGGFEGRDPHPLFHSTFYLNQSADVDVMRVNPLVHFVTCGAAEGRDPNPWFDTSFYLDTDPELPATGENPLVHFLRIGASEQRSTSAVFDTAYYVRANPDVEASGQNPLIHYVLAGHAQGRRTQPPPKPPGPGDTEQSIQAYEALGDRARALETARLHDLLVESPAIVRLPSDDDLSLHVRDVVLPTVASPRVSIVIPVLNEIRLTVECLLSIARFREDVPIEVIVVDNGSDDGTRERLSALSNLVYVRREENTGFVRACNTGAEVARGEYLLFLNNDAQATAGWLPALLKPFEELEGVGVVGPKVLFPDGRLQDAGAGLNADCTSSLIGVFDDPKLARFNCRRDVDYVSGVCLMIEARRFREAGGFDLEFAPAYCEDVDLCLRLRKEGLRIVYEPSAVVVHHLSATSSALSASFKQTMVTRNQQKLSERHQQQIDDLGRTRLIAFYLPQFHPIPENDVWWGKGFTEWRNVTRARPNFEGHYQPRLPADLGFYDLRVGETYIEQTKLAERYGIGGFCFYYYWFDGKRLLEGPVKRLLEEDGSSAFPFCLCWANENWTRRWDGKADDVLVAQSYREEDDVAVIEDLAPYLRHPAYIRVNGRPLLLIYRSARFPDIKTTTSTWREGCRRRGIGDIYLAMVQSFELSRGTIAPEDWGFDAAVEFPPHERGLYPFVPDQMLNPEFRGRVFDYGQTALHYMTEPLPGYRRFRTVMPGWDNTARQQDNPVTFVGSTPGAYQAWLEWVLRQTRQHNFGDERIVFINAWNEWAEGAYLEPDLGWGHGYLEATRDALDNDRLALLQSRWRT